MIIDLPIDADPAVLQRAADHCKVALQPHDAPRVVNSRRAGRILRVEGVRLRPLNGSDAYRAHSDEWGELGRRKNAICWHGHRDWMREILAEYPQAAIEGGRDPETRRSWVWNGHRDFELRHEQSHPENNSGPLGQLRERCKCDD